MRVTTRGLRGVYSMHNARHRYQDNREEFQESCDLQSIGGVELRSSNVDLRSLVLTFLACASTFQPRFSVKVCCSLSQLGSVWLDYPVFSLAPVQTIADSELAYLSFGIGKGFNPAW